MSAAFQIYDEPDVAHAAAVQASEQRRVSVTAVFDENGDAHFGIGNPDGSIAIYHSRSNLEEQLSNGQPLPIPPPIPAEYIAETDLEIATVLRQAHFSEDHKVDDQQLSPETKALPSTSSPSSSSKQISVNFNFNATKSMASPNALRGGLKRPVVSPPSSYLSSSQQPPSQAHVHSFAASVPTDSGTDSELELPPPPPAGTPNQPGALVPQSNLNFPTQALPIPPQPLPSDPQNDQDDEVLPPVPPVPLFPADDAPPLALHTSQSPPNKSPSQPSIRGYFDDNSDDDEDGPDSPFSPGQSFLIIPGQGPGPIHGMSNRLNQQSNQMPPTVNDDSEETDERNSRSATLVSSTNAPDGSVHMHPNEPNQPQSQVQAQTALQSHLLVPMASDPDDAPPPPIPPVPPLSPQHQPNPAPAVPSANLLAPMADSDEELPPPPAVPQSIENTSSPIRRAPPLLKEGGGYQLDVQPTSASPPMMPPIPLMSLKPGNMAPPPTPPPPPISPGASGTGIDRDHVAPLRGGPQMRVGDTAAFFTRMGSPQAGGPQSLNTSAAANENVSSVFNQTSPSNTNSLALADLTSLGPLTVHQPSTPRLSAAPPPPPTKKKGPPMIVAGEVKEVRRVAHFSFDPETGQCSEIPPEWRHELSKKFGIPLPLCATAIVDGYPGRLPPVLLILKRFLIENGGLDQIGIFRLAPDGGMVTEVKNELNANSFRSCDDVNVVAHLIKVWLRELPVMLLDYVKDKNLFLSLTDSVEATGQFLLANFEEPQLSLWYWILDLCNDVADKADVNKMAIPNMGIVIAPNLYRPPDASQDPGLAMRMCKRYTSFCEKAIHWRLSITGKDNRPRGY